MSTTAPAVARRKARAPKDAPMLPNPAKPMSKYKPEYCALVEQWGREGKSRIQCASLLNIDRGTLGNWERDFPEFQRSLARAMAHSQNWWEAKAQQSLGKKHFQAQLWRYSMAGRFKEDYAEARGPADGSGFDLGGFVAGLVDAGARAALASKPQPGDAAKAVEPLDVVVEGDKSGPKLGEQP